MKRVFIFQLSVLLLSASFHAAGFDLVKNGRPAACFDAETVPSGGQIKAFNGFLSECSGTMLPTGGKSEKIPNIIKFRIEKRSITDEDSWSVTFPRPDTMLITGSRFSVRWALNRILEDFAGVRFVMPGKTGTHCPKTGDIAVPPQNMEGGASFNLYREMYMNEPEWGASLNEKKWNHYYFFNHSMWHLFPVEKYGSPEWKDRIMPLRGGKRFIPGKGAHSLWQPCFSNPAAVSEAVKNICAYFDRNPEMRTYSLAVNDLGGFCQCRDCAEQNGGVKKNTFIRGYDNYSNLFYRWADKVIAEVLKKHPGKYFGCTAYREVSEPPDFKVSDRLVVVMALDLYSMCDPGARKSHERFISAWREKASMLGVWEYGYGLMPYSLPRVYFDLQAEIMKYYHRMGVRLLFVESQCFSSEGPKRYLYQKLAVDVGADVKKLLAEWYEACVGREAAPYLAEYYELFNRFWQGEKIRKTPWFQPSNIYLPLDSAGSYLYAFSEEELKKSRELIERVWRTAAETGDEKQKFRAEKLKLYHDYYEARAVRGGASLMPFSGRIRNEEEALRLVRNLPRLFAGSRSLKSVSNRLADLKMKDTLIVPEWHRLTFDKLRVNSDSCPLILLLNRIMPFAGCPAVENALRELSSAPGTQEKFRREIQGFLNRGGTENLLRPGFRAEEWNRRKNRYAARVSPDGDGSVKVISKGGWTSVERSVPMRPESNYLFRVRLSTDKFPVNARLLFSAKREKDGMLMQSYNTDSVALAPGKPEILELAHSTPSGTKINFSEGVLMVIFDNLPAHAAARIEQMEFYDISGREGN